MVQMGVEGVRSGVAEVALDVVYAVLLLGEILSSRYNM